MQFESPAQRSVLPLSDILNSHVFCDVARLRTKAVSPDRFDEPLRSLTANVTSITANMSVDQAAEIYRDMILCVEAIDGSVIVIRQMSGQRGGKSERMPTQMRQMSISGALTLKSGSWAGVTGRISHSGAS